MQEKINKFVYKQRSYQDFYQDMKNGLIPRELEEQLQLVKPSEAEKALKKEISRITKRLLEKSGYSTKKYTPKFFISGDRIPNACCFTDLPIPIMIISYGLINEATSEDELAGVIAHELMHIIMHKDGHIVKNGSSKPEECGADLKGVFLMIEAGYDPRGYIQCFKRHEDADKFLSDKKIIQIAKDVHPHNKMRIRSIENEIAILQRINKPIPVHNVEYQQPEFIKTFKEPLKYIDYKSPVELCFIEIGYETLPTDEKILAIYELIKYLPNKSDEDGCYRDGRRKQMSDYINELKVDLSDEKQKFAFYKLADKIMSSEKKK
jgi:hypothetical protein